MKKYGSIKIDHTRVDNYFLISLFLLFLLGDYYQLPIRFFESFSRLSIVLCISFIFIKLIILKSKVNLKLLKNFYFIMIFYFFLNLIVIGDTFTFNTSLYELLIYFFAIFAFSFLSKQKIDIIKSLELVFIVITTILFLQFVLYSLNIQTILTLHPVDSARGEFYYQYVSFKGDPNIFSYYIQPILFFYMVKLMNMRVRYNIIPFLFYTLVMFFYIFLVLIAGSRGGFLVFLSCSLLCFFLGIFSKKYVKSFIMIILLSACTLILFSGHVFKIETYRFTDQINKGSIQNDPRNEIYYNYLNLYKKSQSYVFGVGYNRSMNLIHDYSHNYYLYLLVNLGIVGLFLYISLLAIFAMAIFKYFKYRRFNDKNINQIITGHYFILVLYCLFSCNFFDHRLFNNAFLLINLLYITVENFPRNSSLALNPSLNNHKIPLKNLLPIT